MEPTPCRPLENWPNGQTLEVVSNLIKSVGPVPTGQYFASFGRWEPALLSVLKRLLLAVTSIFVILLQLNFLVA
jgi:hypothetical protein